MEMLERPSRYAGLVGLCAKSRTSRMPRTVRARIAARGGTADQMWRFREAARSSAHAGPGRLVGIISYDDALRALAA